MALSPKETKKALDNSIKDGAFSDAKYGFSDYFTTPFALAIGATSEMIGLMDSIIQFVIAMAQPISTWIINRFESRRMITIILTLLHRLMWIPIILVPFIFGVGETSVLIVIALFSLIYLTKSIATTAWTSWMCDIVPANIRGRYFGKRSSIGNLSLMAAVVIAGLILDYVGGLNGFVVIFAIALVLGAVSIAYIKKMPEIPLGRAHKKFHFSYRHFLHGVREHKDHSNFVFFMVFLEFARSIHAPFIAVYLLRELHIGYFWFSLLSGILLLSLTIFQIYWGDFADRYGHSRTIKITYVLLPLIPVMLLLVNPSMSLGMILLMLFLYFVFDGFASSGFDLSAFNYLLETIPKDESHIFISNYRFLTNISIAAAYLIGGFLATQYFEGSSLFWISGLQILFLLSILLRVTLPLPFLSRFKPVIHTKPMNQRKLFVRAFTKYPKREILHEIYSLTHFIHRNERKVLRLRYAHFH